MPTGAALLLALCAILASGFGERAASALGLRRRICGAWALCAVAASAVNLAPPLGQGAPVVLINPGGCLVPLAFALFLLTTGPRRARGRAGWRVLGVAGVVALFLAVGTAYGEQSGAAGPTAAVAGCGIAVVGLVLGGDARRALCGVTAGLALSAAALAAAAWAGWAPWPPALGGGVTFDAGTLGAIGTQLLDRVAAAWRAPQPGAAALRASPH